MIWYPSGVISDSLSPLPNDSLIITPFMIHIMYQHIQHMKDVLLTIPCWFRYGFKILTTDSILVGINVSLPNSFSPNEDGQSNYFRVLTNVDLTKTSVMVFTKEERLLKLILGL